MSCFEPVSAQANIREADVKRALARGRSQNWLPDYVAKANSGGIERVLV